MSAATWVREKLGFEPDAAQDNIESRRVVMN